MAAGNIAPMFVDIDRQVLGIYGNRFTKSILSKQKDFKNSTSISAMPNYVELSVSFFIELVCIVCYIYFV